MNVPKGFSRRRGKMYRPHAAACLVAPSGTLAIWLCILNIPAFHSPRASKRVMVQDDHEAVAADPEELFVSCRFEEASRLAIAELLRLQDDETRATECGQEETKASASAGLKSPLTSVPVDLPSGSGCNIVLSNNCGRPDCLASVILHCAYELGREDEVDAFYRHYTRTGSMPYPVAVVWLQLHMSRGHLVHSRQIVTKVLEGLVPLLPPPGDHEEHDVAQQQGAAPEREGKGEQQQEYGGMYSQVMDLLVVNVLLPLGEVDEAMELLMRDRYIDEKQRQHLLECCRAARQHTTDTVNVESVKASPDACCTRGGSDSLAFAGRGGPLHGGHQGHQMAVATSRRFQDSIVRLLRPWGFGSAAGEGGLSTATTTRSGLLAWVVGMVVLALGLYISQARQRGLKNVSAAVLRLLRAVGGLLMGPAMLGAPLTNDT